MTYRAIPLWDNDEACRLLAAAASPKTDSQGRYSLADLVARGAAYQIHDENGKRIAAFLVEASNGALWITAAAGRADVELIPIICDLAEVRARACQLSGVALRTERRGMVRKVQRLGYAITAQKGNAYFLRKTIR